MAGAAEIKTWLDANQDKAGTPDFVTMTNEYSKLGGDGGVTSVTPQSAGSALADKVQSFTKRAHENTAANPTGFDATTGRIVSGAVGGIPDLAIGGYNVGARTIGRPDAQADYLTPQINAATGGAELPPDASNLRRFLEAAGSAALGGGELAGIRAAAAAPTAIGAGVRGVSALLGASLGPTAAATTGGWAGEKAAKTIGADPESGSYIGSLLGSLVGPASVTAFQRGKHSYYAGKAAPNAPAIAEAARQEGVTPTAGMLGNDIIKSQEKNFVAQQGSRNYTSDLRRDARDAIGAVVDRAATERGSTNPTPEPGDIGYSVADMNRRSIQALQDESSQGQAQLMNRVGPESPADISGVLAAMEQVSRSTDPMTAAPINTRVNALRSMLPRDPETGNILSTDVDYQRLKDARTGLREAGEGYDPVPGRHAGAIEGAMTDAMRGAAEDQGVPPHFFDTVQGRTARIMGEGGPVETLTPVSDVRDPTAAYNYLRAGEQNPNNLRVLQSTQPPGVGQPPQTLPGPTGPLANQPAPPRGSSPLVSALDRIFGDYIRMHANKSINTANSRGPVNFADWWQGMAEGAPEVIGGPQQGRLDNAATLARAYDYPPNQMGQTRSSGGIASHLTNQLAGTSGMGAIGGAIGGPTGASIGAATGYGIQPLITYLRARNLQSPAVLNALGGGAAPPLPSLPQLAGTATATDAVQQSRRPDTPGAASVLWHAVAGGGR